MGKAGHEALVGLADRALFTVSENLLRGAAPHVLRRTAARPVDGLVVLGVNARAVVTWEALLPRVLQKRGARGSCLSKMDHK
jgi:hypothetical protein